MSSCRKIFSIVKSVPTVEGAGVLLKRAFRNNETPTFDPFLLLDDFHTDVLENYLAGFPWHPHRGIETVTYLIHGNIEHEDSLGNKGVIKDGDVQWMTAGSGIIHSEMPKQINDLLWGFQLWVNLPSKYKMTIPKYRNISSSQIPEVVLENDVKVKIICGEVNGTMGPVQDLIVDCQFFDVNVPQGTNFEYEVNPDHTVFAYVIDGSAYFDSDKEKIINNDNLVHLTNGNKIMVATDNQMVRFLLLTGSPINEPVAWYGPIVMNTKEELVTAFQEYKSGNFIKFKQ